VTVTYRRSLSCGTAGLATLSLALLSSLAGDAEPGANLLPGVAIGAQALDGLGAPAASISSARPPSAFATSIATRRARRGARTMARLKAIRAPPGDRAASPSDQHSPQQWVICRKSPPSALTA
jgi:hypothetical protein